MKILNRLRRLGARFARAKDGASAIIFALALVPMIGIIGLASDYSTAMSNKTRLNNAIDAAALAGITTTLSEISAGIDTATAQTDGEAQELKTFQANAGTANALLTQTLSTSVVRNGVNVTGQVGYQAASPTNFGGLFNVHSIKLSNNSTATLKMPLYLDFYVMVDVSGSMGIPSTTDEMNRLAKINPDDKGAYEQSQIKQYPNVPQSKFGCIFACHTTTYKACQDTANAANVACQGFTLTRTNGDASQPCPTAGTTDCIQLRMDVISSAVSGLMSTASQYELNSGLTNQFRVGLYPFIVHVNASFQPLTVNLTTNVTAQAAKLPSQLDIGDGTGSGPNWDGVDMGSGGTHLDNALTEIGTKIPTAGDGSSASSTLPFVFLITDGAQDNQIMSGNGAFSGSNNATTISQAACAALRKQATVAILYVPYATIPYPSTIWQDEDDAANTNVANIPPALQSCATPGFFYTASTPADIQTALNAMFNNALQSAPRIAQ